ncbi:MAG TPA: hypothetical protein VLK56_08730, partial [Solirubrobacterales bacterium]|nr:hypothetical protein [Solirubrobacterales bacterium]
MLVPGTCSFARQPQGPNRVRRKEPQGKRQAEGLTGQGEEISMLSPLRNRFGIPGVISVIALVFAMMG